MRSDEIKKGFHRAPHRALLKATGVTDADIAAVRALGYDVTVYVTC